MVADSDSPRDSLPMASNPLAMSLDLPLSSFQSLSRSLAIESSHGHEEFRTYSAVSKHPGPLRRLLIASVWVQVLRSQACAVAVQHDHCAFAIRI